MRRRLARLAGFTSEQRFVVIGTLALLPLVRISLRARGFRWTTTVLTRHSDRAAIAADVDRARRDAEAVAVVAGRSVVGARCLDRSLVLWFLLRRRGIDADLVIGADRPEAGRLPAHAWVEVAGEPVNDAPDVRERFGSFDLRLPRLAAPHAP